MNKTFSVALVCHRYSEALIKKKHPKRGIRPLMRAVEKLQTNENQLTSIHADLCLVSFQFSAEYRIMVSCYFFPALPSSKSI